MRERQENGAHNRGRRPSGQTLAHFTERARHDRAHPALDQAFARSSMKTITFAAVKLVTVPTGTSLSATNAVVTD